MHDIILCTLFLVAPLIHPFNFGEESVNEGDGVSVQCTVSKGDYPLNITWNLNGNPVSKSDGILINRASKRVSTLSIDYVVESQAGNYTCVATNNAATVSYTAKLAVNGTVLSNFVRCSLFSSIISFKSKSLFIPNLFPFMFSRETMLQNSEILYDASAIILVCQSNIGMLKYNQRE